MNTFKKVIGGFVVAGVMAVSLVGCSGGTDWDGKYKVTQERLDASGVQYVTVKVDGVDSKDTLKSFADYFTANTLDKGYMAHDSLMLRVEDGGKVDSFVRIANTDKGSAQTGLDKHTADYQYNN